MKDKQKYAVIVAGGSGKRMKNDIPKQFIEIAGKPILMHTITQFYNTDSKIQIIVVLPVSQHNNWLELVDKHSFIIKHQIVKGGIERFYSVLNGLKKTTKNSLIAIHDGVRPLVSINTITKCFDMAAEKGTAIPVMPATESIRKVSNNSNKAVTRSKYFMVQTPQVFRSEIIMAAYKQEYDCNFTDDAGVVEKSGVEIHLVDGNVENIKITRPLDLKIAEILLNSQVIN